MPPQRDAYASIRQRAARALLESTTLDGAVAEILGTISNELDWPLAIYWIAGADDRRLHCRSIWAAETLKRADVVEASRIAIVSPDAEDDPVGRAYGRREPVWIEHLASAGAAAGTRLALAIDAGLESLAAFPIADQAGAVGAIELYAPRARPADDAMLALMAEVGHEICEVFRRAGGAGDRAGRRVALARRAGPGAGGDPGRDHGPRRRRAHHLRERRRRAHLWLRVGRRDAARLWRRYRAALPDVGRDRPAAFARGSAQQPGDGAANARASCSATGRTTASWTAGSPWSRFRSPTIAAVSERVVNVTHDMTKQRGVELDNVRLVGEAQEALRAREDLLAIVSHDLRNPLGVVLASTALLLKAQPAARQAGTGAPSGRGDPARRQPHEPADPRPARLRQHPGGPPVGQHAAAGGRRDGERGAGGDGAARRGEVAAPGGGRRARPGDPVRSRSRHPAVLQPGRQRREVHARRRHHHGPRRP